MPRTSRPAAESSAQRPAQKTVIGTRRVRAKSPFLPSSAREESKVNAQSPLGQMLHAVPALPGDMGGALALSDLPTWVPGVRFELSEEQARAGAGIFKQLHEHDIRAYADNSRRSIRADWRHWLAFCAVRNKVAMPIAFEDLKEFLDALIEAGYKRASLDHLLFTLKLACRIWSCPNPAERLEFRWYWQQQSREKLSRQQHQAAPLNVEDLDEITRTANPDDPRSLRDAAFAAVAYDLMARASELVAMEWALIDFEADPRGGGATYTIRKSKTDQEQKGVEMYLTADTVALLRAWGAHRFSENPYVFHALPRHPGQRMQRDRPLNVREAGRIFERLALKSGMLKPLSGHSARVGGAQDMTRAGMDLPAIMQQGRWKSPTMPARYSAKEIASRAGKARADRVRRLKSE